MSIRTEIVEFLATNLSDAYVIQPYTDDFGDLKDLTIAVETTSYGPGPASGLWAVSVTVYVVAPWEDFGRAEDALDAAVPDVLSTLEGTDHISLTADRVVIAERHHAFKIETTFALAKSAD